MPRPKTMEEYTYDELVDEATQHAHGELLAHGGKGLRLSIFMWMQTAMRWREHEVQQEQKKAKRGKKPSMRATKTR